MHRMLTKGEVLELEGQDMPVIVLSDKLGSIISWRIKRHTSGEYSHVMWMAHPGEVGDQGVLFRIRSLVDWLDGNYRLKFWRGREWGDKQRLKVADYIQGRSSRRWFRRLYDPLGIIGQRFSMRWIQLPGLYYCSEDVAVMLQELEPSFVLRRPSPADINRWCKDNPRIMKEVGVYDPNWCSMVEWQNALKIANHKPEDPE